MATQDKIRYAISVTPVEQLADEQAKIVLLWDDFGFKNGLFMSPKSFNKYVFPWYNFSFTVAHKIALFTRS